MCGAFGFLGVSGFQHSINIFLRYQLKNKPEAIDSYNIRPSMRALVVTRNSPNEGKLLPFGIPAPWNPDQLLINAKSETVSTLRTFKKMFTDSRCIIPASFYYEWQKHENGTKTPYLFRLKTNLPFAFAGLYNDSGFVILTTAPNSLGEPVHSRMPLLLHKADEDVWLDKDSTEGDLTDLMVPYPASEMVSYTVSPLVNYAKNQGADLIKPTEPVKKEKVEQESLI